MNRIKEGSLVKIHQFVVHTIKEYQINSKMNHMVGKKYRVEGVSGNCVTIGGWNWHIKDLRLAHPQKTEFKFNENELVTP